MDKKGKQPGLQPMINQAEEEKELKVSILINSVHYLLGKVFIVEDKRQFRLIVFNEGKLLTDMTYKTVKGARIAFLKFWGYKKAIKNINPIWSHFYPPDKYWLETWYHFIIERRNISVLINRILYFMETVFIMTVKDQYRLVVINKERLRTDEIYKTFEEAKRAFLNKYKYKAWGEEVKPNWSIFYPPDTKWLKKKLELINKAR
jgi:hypothetical protein